jgi:Arc/MetJ-type ribon-helix-helix transcriptional regulator
MSSAQQKPGNPTKLRAAKIAITLDQALLRDVDQWVVEGKYPNRSQAIAAALREKSARWHKTMLYDSLEQFTPEDAAEAVAMAEEWGELAGEWPEY